MKTDMSMELDSSFTKTLWMPSWDADQSPADSLPFVWSHHRLTSPSSKLMPQTTDYDEDDVEDFYDQLQEVIDQAPKKDILVVQGDWNAKIGEDANKNWKGTCGQYCKPETHERGLRLLEFASYNNLKVANTFGTHKPSRRWTWHSPGGDYRNQIDYIMIKRRFQSSVNIAKTRSFPGADIGSDHELVMMTFKLHLQRVKNQGSIRIRFSLEKLKDPNIADFFFFFFFFRFSSNDRRKVCSTPFSWKSGHRNRHPYQQL